MPLLTSRRTSCRYGVRQLAGGAGPIVFSTIYRAFNKRGGELPYFPGAPYILGAFLLLIALGFALALPNPVPDLPKEQARFVARKRAASIPTYLPSTPRTPVSIPRRGSTGFYGTPGRRASPATGEDCDSPLLMRTDPERASRIIDAVVDDVISRPPALIRVQTT